jgi:hypothetical protein
MNMPKIPRCAENLAMPVVREINQQLPLSRGIPVQRDKQEKRERRTFS